jgi:small subunit ribosomal protein S7
MSRRASAPTRTILPDPRFNSLLLAKFVNMVMERGKKSVAEKIVYGAVDRIAEKSGKQPDQSIELLAMALDNVKPTVEVKSRRVGGATYQVPMEVRPERRVALGMRWLVQHARTRGEKTMRERLAAEFVDAAQLRGGAVKKKDDTHRMADANKAFAHYRW